MVDVPKREEAAGFGRERVGRVMTGAVATVRPTDKVQSAARLMEELDCGSLPVVDASGRPVGMITDRDIALHIAGRGLDSSEVDVRECMTEEVVSCPEDATIEDCLGLMSRRQVRRIPIVNPDGTLVGIVSQADFALDAAADSGSGKRRLVASMVSAVSEPNGS
jgi:CBS domain-containing protein